MTVNALYDKVFAQVCQLWPQERLTRQRLMSWFIVGLLCGRSVHLARIAGHIPGAACLSSSVRRLSRFLANKALRVRPRYAPLVRQIVQAAAQQVGEIRLVVDGTKVTAQHQLLLVGLAYQRRVVPLAWTWVRRVKGHSTAHKQLALLAYVRTLVPAGVPVLLVGDCEFGPIPVLQQLEAWGWSYVLRQKGNRLVYPKGIGLGCKLRQLGLQPGAQCWLTQALLTKDHAYPLNVLGYWQAGEPEPWFLASNLAHPQRIVQAYRRRMWIDELFGDLKGHGVDLEHTHLVQIARLSRLVLLVALFYLLLIGLGARQLKAGHRYLVDRRHRRDLSLFQIGWRLLQRWLTNAQPLPPLRLLVPF
jgi:Transposase DDE domain